jgi:hypothetical protein
VNAGIRDPTFTCEVECGDSRGDLAGSNLNDGIRRARLRRRSLNAGIQRWHPNGRLRECQHSGSDAAYRKTNAGIQLRDTGDLKLNAAIQL